MIGMEHAEIAPEQEADFWQDDIRHENRFRTIRCEIICSMVLDFATVIQRD